MPTLYIKAAPAATSVASWCDFELLKTFYHEAAHAVIARLTDFEVAWVSVDMKFIQSNPIAIQNRCNSGAPLCMTISSLRLNPILNKRRALTKPEKETVIGYCMHVLAGPAAELRLHPESFMPQPSANDFGQVMTVLTYVEPNKTLRKKLLDTAKRKLNRALDDHWSAVHDVAEALRQRSTLTGEEVDQIIMQFEPVRSAA